MIEPLDAAATHIDRLVATVAAQQERIEALEEALQKLVQWSEAYPLDIFPEPDLHRARDLLEAGGMTLDSISATAMRHVIKVVGQIARAALDQSSPPPRPEPSVPFRKG